MDKSKLACVFQVAYFGPWPDYFPFWARSCIANATHFKWFLYTDQIRAPRSLNPAVELIPYSLAQMRREIGQVLNGTVPECAPRKACELRMLLYPARMQAEQLKPYNYFGYCDIDMVFGNILEALPADLFQHSVIGAHEGRPTGPFTMIRTDCAERLIGSPGLKEAICRSDYGNFDENPQWVDALKSQGAAWLQAAHLQPARDGRFIKDRCVAEWTRGGLTVTDGTRAGPAGFFHFGKLKGKRSFRVRRNCVDADRWRISEHGIYDADSPPWRVKLADLRRRFAPSGS